MTYNKKLTLPALFYNSVEKYAAKTSIVFAGEEDYTYVITSYSIHYTKLYEYPTPITFRLCVPPLHPSLHTS